MIFSCIIAAKSDKDPLLEDCIGSIRRQFFPQDQIEILVITEGDPESARAIGLRKAKGDICVIVDSDNFFTYNVFADVKKAFDAYPDVVGYYSLFYYYKPTDNSLNRYFSLIGNNDPVAFYLGKADRYPYYLRDDGVRQDIIQFDKEIPTLGCNGFFVRRSAILKSDLDHCYHIDVCEDMRLNGHKRYIRDHRPYLWHRTSDNLFKFLRKRYRYARDLYCYRDDRRWKIISTRKDRSRLALFILGTLTILEPFMVSGRGYRMVKDWAWFWHPIVCWGFLITYGALTIRWKLSQLLSRLLTGPKVSQPV